MKRLKAIFQRRKPGTTQNPTQVTTQQPLDDARTIPENAPQPSRTAEPVAAATRHGDTNQVALNIQANPGILRLELQNNTTSSNVYAYVTGQAIDRGNALFLLQSDGVTPYYPVSPSSILQPLQANCAIPLGAPGSSRPARIPHIAGGRIWFSVDSTLTFQLNPGPALVEPSVTNPSDPNINKNWVFAELTFNADQLYANISYVDFVSLPVSLTLRTVSNSTQRVLGLAPDGLKQIATGLLAQEAADHQGWDRLVRNQPGTSTPMRILSPNLGMIQHPEIFNGYYNSYVDQVFAKYAGQPLTVDTQAGFGSVKSSGTPSLLTFGSETFQKPSTADIFTCSTGPFATGSSPLRNALIPRLAAAFNRSTLLVTSSIPAPSVDLFYQNQTTNHYARLVHAANRDHKGYAFPYDDVQASGQPDQSGKVQAGDPALFVVTVGATT